MDQDRDQQQLNSFASQPAGVSEARIAPGTVLDDKYQIAKHLGVGGMGSVYSAIHLKLGNQVAIKVLHPHFASDPEAVVRFQREARIISGLQHKNILAVYAFGSWQGVVYMAIELVEGHSLGQQIADGGPLKAEHAVPLLLQICDAMTFAHKNNVLHRDLKPDNVLVVKSSDAASTVKVVDFGLAKLLGNNDMQRLTQTGEVIGDPNYMSPEQCQGRQLDARSDIYSFGCLMYEVFSGKKPFLADGPVATLMKQVSEEPPPLAKHPTVSPMLEAIIWRAMQKDPDMRYKSFEALADELGKYAANPEASIGGRPLLRGTTRSAGTRKRLFLTCAAVFLLVSAAAAALWTVATNHDTRPPTDPYENLALTDLRHRARVLMTSTTDNAKKGHFASARKSLTELELLRHYLADDFEAQGEIDFHIAYVAMAEAAEKTPPLTRKALEYYSRSAENLKKAHAAVSSKQSDAQLANMQRSRIEERLIQAFDGERRAGGYLKDNVAVDRACRETLEFCEGRSTPIDSARSQSTQVSFDWLFARALQTKHLKRAYRLMKRKMAFLETQKVDPEFLNDARADMERQLVKAIADQQDKRFSKLEDLDDAGAGAGSAD